MPGTLPASPSTCLNAYNSRKGYYLRHFRDNWFPRLLDRKNRRDWEAGGQLTQGDRVAARVQEVLEHHEPAPLDETTVAELEAVIQRAEERVR